MQSDVGVFWDATGKDIFDYQRFAKNLISVSKTFCNKRSLNCAKVFSKSPYESFDVKCVSDTGFEVLLSYI